MFLALQSTSNQIAYGLTDFTDEEIIDRRDEALANAIRFEKDATTLLFYQAIEAWNDFQHSRALRLISEFLEKRPNALVPRREVGLQWRRQGGGLAAILHHFGGRGMTE